jgi:tetratricopeptide (TPR) repeat protein
VAKAYQENLEDYPSAIAAYEKMLNEFPESVYAEEAMFNLLYCYNKVGDGPNVQRIKQAITSRFPAGNFTALILNPNLAQTPDSISRTNATRKYEEIYNLFIEGKFDEALRQKKIADSAYGNSYWTPQLLYIQAVYHIRQRQDTMAIDVLSGILQLYPTSPLALKSQNLIQVVARRKEIETYLTNLQIERPTEDSVVIKNQPVVKAPVRQAPARQVPARTNTTQQTQPNAVNLPPVTTQGNNPTTPSIDTIRSGNKPAVSPSIYTHKPEEPHYVVLVLDKVDPVYVTESRNAFIRYNKERYYNKQIDITNLPLTDDVKLVLFSSYADAAAAIDYIEKAKKLTQSEIIPWLAPQKYAFMIITASNLEVLKNLKDIGAYRTFLGKSYPNYFK